MVWDAFKAFTRGHYISAIKAAKVHQTATTESLKSKIEMAPDQYGSDQSASNFDLLQASKRNFHLHLTEVMRLELYKTKQRFFEQGDRHGRLLEIMSHNDAPLTLVPKLTSPTGEAVSSQEFLSAFVQQYTTLRILP